MLCWWMLAVLQFHEPVVYSGYDSDVAREKLVDYVTKIYSASIRNMSGTRPHLQHKELPVEERYRRHMRPQHHTVVD